MRRISHRERLLIAAAVLRLPARTQRLLASGDDAVLRAWAQAESPRRLAEARTFAYDTAELLDREGARMVAYSDPDYPRGLAGLASPPPFLIVRGALPLRGVAIVGSRTPPPEAAAFALVLARSLREPVIAGLALGIDAAVHHGAIAGGWPTLAYVGYGLGETYPAAHRELEDEIVATGGGIASERLPGEEVATWALVKRDRLQAAHAGAVVLICSELDGGAMHTMHFAAELGRPRFALDVQGTPEYEGNVQARRAGARALPMDVPAAVEMIRAALEES